MPLPAPIRNLMLNTVKWEALLTKDGYGDETYAAPVTLSCHIEAAGLSGGVEMFRHLDESRAVPILDLYFDGADVHAQQFSLNDRFTVTGAGNGLPLQAKTIDEVYGPAGDVWVYRVTLG